MLLVEQEKQHLCALKYHVFIKQILKYLKYKFLVNLATTYNATIIRNPSNDIINTICSKKCNLICMCNTQQGWIPAVPGSLEYKLLPGLQHS